MDPAHLCTLYTLGSHFSLYVFGARVCFMAPISCGYILMSLWLLVMVNDRGKGSTERWMGEDRRRESALCVLTVCDSNLSLLSVVCHMVTYHFGS